MIWKRPFRHFLRTNDELNKESMAKNSYIWNVELCVGQCSLLEYSTMCHTYCSTTSDVSTKSKENIQSRKIINFGQILCIYFDIYSQLFCNIKIIILILNLQVLWLAEIYKSRFTKEYGGHSSNLRWLKFTEDLPLGHQNYVFKRLEVI